MFHWRHSQGWWTGGGRGGTGAQSPTVPVTVRVRTAACCRTAPRRGHGSATAATRTTRPGL